MENHRTSLFLMLCFGFLFSYSGYATDPQFTSDLASPKSDVVALLATAKSAEDLDVKNEKLLAARNKILDLAVKHLDSDVEETQAQTLTYLLEAAHLMVGEGSLAGDDTEGGLGDGLGYNFGTMANFPVIADEDAPFRCVLSIDGGGIRGLIPALYMQWIEEGSGKKILNLFDSFAGTSIGGILGLGLNHPNGQEPSYSASELVDLFKARGDDIFPQGGKLSKLLAPFHFIGENLMHSSYKPGQLEKLLQDYFGDVWLRDCLKPVLVASIETSNPSAAAKEFLFSSELAKRDPSENYLLRDVARSTSAATTYFPAAKVENHNRDLKRFVDGGLTMNNPAELAYHEAKNLFPGEKIALISLGTGTPHKTKNIPHDAGAARSAKPLIENMMTMNSQHTHLMFGRGVLADGDAYVRVQVSLTQEIDLDDASAPNIQALEQAAELMRMEIEKIKDFLVSNHGKRGNLD